MTDTYRQPGVVLTDRRFTVPLDHDNPSGETIELYAREVVARDKADRDLPWLLYLQGGPGFGANRFIGKQAWLGRALEDYRVLLLDQRGTGASTPANRQTLPLRGGPAEQAGYLTRFRSDAIVRDCEAIRPQVTGGARWTVLGQSFGGFCTVTYLSMAPEGLDTALITGGLPSSTRTPTTSTGPPTRASSARSPPTTPATRRTSSAPVASPTTSSPTTWFCRTATGSPSRRSSPSA